MIRLVPSGDGSLTVFKQPTTNTARGHYVIGADATGTTHGDYAVAQVINRVTLEQVAVFRRRVDPKAFAHELNMLGRYYNNALLAPEVTGPGALTMGILLGINYPNLYLRESKLDRTPGKRASGELWGWETTAQTKYTAINYLLSSLNQQSLTIHDATTFNEMRHYEALPNGGYGNGSGAKHDDTVMALAIALAAHFTSPWKIPLQVPTSTFGRNHEGAQQLTAQRLVEEYGMDTEGALALPGVATNGWNPDADDYFSDESRGLDESTNDPFADLYGE